MCTSTTELFISRSDFSWVQGTKGPMDQRTKGPMDARRLVF